MPSSAADSAKCDLLFDDHLAIVSSSSGCHLGDLTIATSAVRHTEHGYCLSVRANSQGIVGGVPCGTVITASVARLHLETLEHRQHEFAVVRMIFYGRLPSMHHIACTPGSVMLCCNARTAFLLDKPTLSPLLSYKPSIETPKCARLITSVK